MPAERYFCDASLLPEQRLIFSNGEFHHLVNVMRCRQGATVEVINGKGVLAKAKLCEIDKRSGLALLEVTEVYTAEKPKVELIIVQAIPRLNRLDTVVEKGTELGMTQLWLFAGDKSERKELSTTQWSRLNLVAIAAIKQSGRLYLPQLIVKPPVKVWKELQGCWFYGDVKKNAIPLYQLLDRFTLMDEIFFCIGPESGFSVQEEEKLRALGAKGAKLHHNILRTDTAPLAALTLLDHFILMHETFS